MCEKYVEGSPYLLIADWMMAEGRWITTKEISRHFDIEYYKAINTFSCILSEVGEIVYEVKVVPNQTADRGCQYQRLVKVASISSHFYSRPNHDLREKKVSMVKTPCLSVVPPTELNHEQKRQMTLSKSMRR